MSHEFRNPHGFVAITGVHVLPIAIVAVQNLQLLDANTRIALSFPSMLILLLLSLARTYASLVEIWIFVRYIQNLLQGGRKSMLNETTIKEMRRQSGGFIDVVSRKMK